MEREELRVARFCYSPSSQYDPSWSIVEIPQDINKPCYLKTYPSERIDGRPCTIDDVIIQEVPRSEALKKLAVAMNEMYERQDDNRGLERCTGCVAKSYKIDGIDCRNRALNEISILSGDAISVIHLKEFPRSREFPIEKQNVMSSGKMVFAPSETINKSAILQKRMEENRIHPKKISNDIAYDIKSETETKKEFVKPATYNEIAPENPFDKSVQNPLIVESKADISIGIVTGLHDGVYRTVEVSKDKLISSHTLQMASEYAALVESRESSRRNELELTNSGAKNDFEQTHDAAVEQMFPGQLSRGGLELYAARSADDRYQLTVSIDGGLIGGSTMRATYEGELLYERGIASSAALQMASEYARRLEERNRQGEVAPDPIEALETKISEMRLPDQEQDVLRNRDVARAKNRVDFYDRIARLSSRDLEKHREQGAQWRKAHSTRTMMGLNGPLKAIEKQAARVSSCLQAVMTRRDQAMKEYRTLFNREAGRLQKLYQPLREKIGELGNSLSRMKDERRRQQTLQTERQSDRESFGRG